MSGAAEARARAARFAREHGDGLARARVDAQEGGAAAGALGFLPEPADAASTWTVLEVAEELRALRAPAVRAASAFAATLQTADGALAPGDASLDERLRLTGNIAGVLARSPFARPELLDAAGSFLAAHFAPERVQDFQWENVAAYAHFFANALHDASDEILQWCGRELERGYRARRFDAVATARVFVLCDAHGIPGAQLEREELLLSLLTEQGVDGSFGAASSPSERVEPTLHGLRALAFLDTAAPVR